MTLLFRSTNTARCDRPNWYRHLSLIAAAAVAIISTPASAHNPPTSNEKRDACANAIRDGAAGAAATAGALATGVTIVPALILAASQGALLALAVRDAERCSDPIDNNFTVLTSPVIPTINTLLASLPQATRVASTSTLNDVATHFFENVAELIGYTDAVVTTTERMMGARVTHNFSWAEKQSQLLVGYRTELGYLTAVHIRLSEQLASALEQAGVSEKLTESDVANYVATLDRTGLPANEIPMLKELIGATDEDVLNITANQYTFAQGIAGSSFPALLAAPNRISSYIRGTRLLTPECASVAFVEASLGLEEIDPGFIPDGDLNGDATVDAADLQLARSNLSSSVVCP